MRSALRRLYKKGYPPSRRLLQTRPRPRCLLLEGGKARMIGRLKGQIPGGGRRRSTKACWPCRSRGGFATETMSGLSRAPLPDLRPAAFGCPPPALAQCRALGRRVSDEFTVPLCRGHHREVHRCGDETAWWSRFGIDPMVRARAFWLQMHPLPTAQTKTEIKDKDLQNWTQ